MFHVHIYPFIQYYMAVESASYSSSDLVRFIDDDFGTHIILTAETPPWGWKMGASDQSSSSAAAAAVAATQLPPQLLHAARRRTKKLLLKYVSCVY